MFRLPRLITAASAIVFGIVLPAAAQTSHPAILREALKPDVLMRDVRFFADELDLDEGQLTIMRVLVADYHDAFDEQSVTDWFDDAKPVRPPTPELDETRVRLRGELRTLFADPALRADEDEMRRRVAEIKQTWRDAVPPPDPVAQRAEAERENRFSVDLADHLDAWHVEKTRLLSRFLADVPVTLADEQRERWPAVERRFRRNLSLARGRLSGERVDLTVLIARLDLAPVDRATIAPLLQEYEIALDSALRARDAAIDRGRIATLRAQATGDRASAADQTVAQTAARVAVRNVNDDHAASISAALPTEPGARLASTYTRRAYAQAYRPIAAERKLATSLRRPGLAENERAEVMAWDDALRAELAPINARLAEAIRRAEVAEYARGAYGAPRASSVTNEMTELRQQKIAIGARYESLLQNGM